MQIPYIVDERPDTGLINSKLGISNLIGEHALSNSFDLGFYHSLKEFNV